MSAKRQSVHRVEHGKKAIVREPVTMCFYCGARSDLGCSHHMTFGYFALRDREVADQALDREIRMARADAGYGDLNLLKGPGWSDVNPEPKR